MADIALRAQFRRELLTGFLQEIDSRYESRVALRIWHSALQVQRRPVTPESNPKFSRSQPDCRRNRFRRRSAAEEIRQKSGEDRHSRSRKVGRRIGIDWRLVIGSHDMQYLVGAEGDNGYSKLERRHRRESRPGAYPSAAAAGGARIGRKKL